MGLYDQAREEAKSNEGRAFSPHALGQFPGTVEEVKGGAYQGRDFFEIKIRTKYGVAKTSVWRTTEKDDLPHLMNKGMSQDEAATEIKKRWTRICRLYNDLGLESPTTELGLYNDLGNIIGKPCWTVVKENQRDPQNPVVFINAPKKNGVAKAESPAPQAQTGSIQPYAPAPGMEDVPF